MNPDNSGYSIVISKIDLVQPASEQAEVMCPKATLYWEKSIQEF